MDFNNLNGFSLEFSRTLQQTGWLKSAACCCLKKSQELVFLFNLFLLLTKRPFFWCAPGIDREVWRQLNVSKGQGLLLGENKNKYSWCLKHRSPGVGCGFTCAAGTSGSLYQMKAGSSEEARQPMKAWRQGGNWAELALLLPTRQRNR